MPDLVIGYDPSQPPGERLSTEVQQEISIVAPSTVNDGSITEAKFADQAVSTRAIADDAVTTDQIATGGVATSNLADDAVTAAKIAPGALTPDNVAPGVVTAHDSAGNAISLDIVFVTAAEYAALASPNPNTEYHISS